ncbi:MAG: hypothetical protein GC134_02130 [Proteobacteria bacterium]|nr:hypothetical protein [Pseudomonadota bacterium]
MVDFAQNDASMTLALDIYGNARTIDAPTGAELTYSKKGVLFAAIPDVTGFVRVSPLLDAHAPEVRVEKIGEGPILNGYKTVNWRLLVNRKPCGQLFTSAELAKALNFNMTDISRLNLATGLLATSDISTQPCTYYDVPRALGNMLGFPLAYEGVDGTTKVLAIRNGDKVIYDMPPKNLQRALGDDVRALFLKSRLPTDVQKTYENTRPGDLTPDEKVEVLKHLQEVPQR